MKFSLPVQDCYDPLSLEAIRACERRMGICLPQNYRELLLEYNGGDFMHDELIRLKHTGPFNLDRIILKYLCGVGTVYLSQELEDERRLGLEQDLPTSVLLFARSAADNGIVLGLEHQWAGGIYYWWREEYEVPDDLILIADSLEEFADGIFEDPAIQYFEESEPVFRAIELGLIDDVKEFLDAGGDVNTRSKVTGRTLIICATHSRRLDVLRLFIDRGADLAMTDDKWGASPLHWAATSHTLDATKLLLNAGANINQLNNEGDSPLIAGLKVGGKRVPILLIESGAEINIPNKKGETALSCTDDADIRVMLGGLLP